MRASMKGKVTNIFNYGFTIVTEDGTKGTLKNADIIGVDRTTLKIGSELNVVDSGKRSVKGGIIWSLFDSIDNSRDVVMSSFPLAALFKNRSREDAESLFSTIVDNLPYIDSDNIYELAKQLIQINRSFSPVLTKGFVNQLFIKSNKNYKLRLWLENYISYCDMEELAKLINEGNSNAIELLSSKYNIRLFNKVESDIELLTKDIEQQLLIEIANAQKSISVAVAWFTNPVLFSAIEESLDNGISIKIVLNNDLINNGGYCLDFNRIINKGAEVHVVEYPSHMNNKFCIIDDRVVFSGSYNWTFYAEHNNDENCLLIKDDAKIAQAYMMLFNELISKYDKVDEMPDTVPDRPEFDRSSFKHYISNELAYRARVCRSTTEKAKLYKSALQLQPHNTLVPDSYRQDSSKNIQQREAVTRTLQQHESRRQNEERQVQNLRQRREEIIQESPENETEINQLTTKIEQLETSIEDARSEEKVLEAVGNTSLEGQSGKLRINLKWETTDDLDLHLCLPNGKEIYFSDKEQVIDGFKGYLDVDANAHEPFINNPQENIYWDSGLAKGQYTVKVVLYRYRSSENRIPFVVTIWPQDKDPIIKTHTIKKTEDGYEVVIAKFTYAKSRGIIFQ